ncbi:DUF4376 domain-containing protein [Edwardsiella tarda]|uniref:DUF4376 domain-containing protein n=1 Tax=Edwardsiella tarda TaxID=636 RepID=UPI0024441FCC|nr:DUF4376 domain-containing protein [Edwardsiella tarda]WGE30536.1 DUF4376 domain-containing protein [Edwardsiella tarda]
MGDLVNDVKYAVYNENGSINCQVRPAGITEYLPYTAGENDTDAFGKVLWQQLIEGKWGVPAPFIATPAQLVSVKQAKRVEINRWRDTQESGNYPFELDGHRWDCGKATQARLSPVVSVAHAGLLPASFFWTDADNNDVPMTADKLIALEAAMQQQMVVEGFKIHERQRQMKEDIDLMTDYTAVKNYVVGWS